MKGERSAFYLLSRRLKHPLSMPDMTEGNVCLQHPWIPESNCAANSSLLLMIFVSLSSLLTSFKEDADVTT